MIRYGLSKRDGRILFEPQEEQSSILLMTFDQFQKEKKYPHHLVLEKSIRTARYCKVEIFAECVQGTICIPKKQEEGKEKLIFGFYLNQEGILLVGDEKRLSALIGKMSQSVRGCMTPRHFLLLLLEFLIAEDVLYLQTIEDRISGFEEKLLEKIPDHFYQSIISCRKEISVYHSYYEQLMNLSDQIQEFLSDQMPAEELRAWQMYANRTERLHNHVEMLREYVVQLRELYQSRIDMEQNRIMTLLTVVTTLFMPLTLIAGWYGMNFVNMPALSWKYGYPAVIVISVLIIVLEVIYFRKKKML